MENLLYNVPRAEITIATLSDILLNPKVKVVEHSCGTSLGTQLDSTFLNSSQPDDLYGNSIFPYTYSLKVSGVLQDGEVPPFYTTEELSQSIASGVRFQKVYHPFSCTSTGGICRVCAYAAYAFSTADVETFTESYPYNGIPAPFSIAAPAIGQTVQIHLSYGRSKGFLAPSQKALFSWLANTYSGSMLGIKNFGNYPMPVNTQLYERIINANLLTQAVNALAKNQAVPRDIINYIDNLPNILEKALMVVVTYTMYGPRYQAAISKAPTITV